VFGTDRQSDHTRGRAVDIYRLDQTLVIDDRAEGSFTHQIVKWLYDQPEIRQIGSPWRLEGPRGRSFTDRLHQDHLHVAVAR
jgi:NAD(P)H-flavin reductase